MKYTEKIILNWKVREIVNTARVTAMYCFKNCVNNQN